MNKKLLLEYLFLYPLAYVVAMFVAVLAANIFLEWDSSSVKKTFYGLAVIMWFASYIIHYETFFKMPRK